MTTATIKRNPTTYASTISNTEGDVTLVTWHKGNPEALAIAAKRILSAMRQRKTQFGVETATEGLKAIRNAR